MKPIRLLTIIETGILRISRGGDWLAGIVLLLMILLGTADVTGRFVFNKPIKGAVEINELMMVAVVFLAMGYCTAERGHVQVDLLVSHLPKNIQRILDGVCSILSAAIFGLLTWQLGLGGWRELVSPLGRATMLLEIRQAPFLLIAAAGSLLVCVQLLAHFFYPFPLAGDSNKSYMLGRTGA